MPDYSNIYGTALTARELDDQLEELRGERDSVRAELDRLEEAAVTLEMQYKVAYYQTMATAPKKHAGSVSAKERWAESQTVDQLGDWKLAVVQRDACKRRWQDCRTDVEAWQTRSSNWREEGRWQHYKPQETP